MKFRPGESRAHVLSFCAILWLGTSGSIPWLDFVSLGKKVSGVLIFFPPPDRTAALIQQRASSLPLLSSMHVACCCLLLPVEFFFFHFFHHTAKPTDLVTSLPFRYLADCVVGWSVRVIFPVSVKHFFWLISEIGWVDDRRIMHIISKSVGRCRLPWADVLFVLFLYCGYRRRR